MPMIDAVRDRVVRSATDPFGHTDYPLANTLRHRGDAGLFGPGSMSWRVIGDAAAFAGGVRALLIQAAHPEVVAGVADHSKYMIDPLGRLSRTSSYVTATTFGAMPEVREAVARVRRAHVPVRGTSHRNVAYTADTPQFAAWVHNALTDSFLQCYQAFGPSPLTPTEADMFVAEQTRVGALLDADPLPETATELASWIALHPSLAGSPGMRETRAFLTDPPLEPTQRLGYQALYRGARSTIPDRIRAVLGIDTGLLDHTVGTSMTGFLRWALGSSPSWHLALIRVEADIPDGLFHQPLPVDPADSTPVSPPTNASR